MDRFRSPRAAGGAGQPPQVGRVVQAVVSATNKAHLLGFFPQARFQNLRVNGASVWGEAGCLAGPPLDLKPYLDVFQLAGNELSLANAGARGIAEAFDQWRSQVTIPNLPFFPSLARFGRPRAPATRCVPAPLVYCQSAGVASITDPQALEAHMARYARRLLRGPHAALSQEILRTIAAQLAHSFATWLNHHQVQQLEGWGQVPYPPGPVIGGAGGPL